MQITRGFLLFGSLYLLIGIFFGMHMGASGDHSLAPVHAHILLIGFVLSSIFGLSYGAIQGLREARFAKAHLWLHQIGAALLSLGLFLLMAGHIPEETIGPFLLVPELALLGGAVAFGINILRSDWR